jgi:hypothetical protein
MVKVAVLAALAFAAFPAAALAQTPTPPPPQSVSALPKDLFEPLPSAPPPQRTVHAGVRDRDRLLVGSALAMLAVAASTLLLLAQARRVRRELLI